MLRVKPAELAKQLSAICVDLDAIRVELGNEPCDARGRTWEDRLQDENFALKEELLQLKSAYQHPVAESVFRQTPDTDEGVPKTFRVELMGVARRIPISYYYLCAIYLRGRIDALMGMSSTQSLKDGEWRRRSTQRGHHGRTRQAALTRKTASRATARSAGRTARILCRRIRARVSVPLRQSQSI